MTAQMPTERKTTGLIPDDLRQLVDERTLVYLVLEACHGIKWPHCVLPAGEEDSTPEPVLRTLILFCYAVGTYGSPDIEYAPSNDKTAAYICAGHQPSWVTIRHFRRQRAFQLKEALAELLRLVYKEARSHEGLYSTLARGRFGGDLSLEFIRDAEQRLHRAIQADSMALDE
jgi:hypothetical protein